MTEPVRWLSELECARNALQPVRHFVKRPPLEPKIMLLVFAVAFAGFGFVVLSLGFASYFGGFISFMEPWADCHNAEGAMRDGCVEDTVYPKKVRWTGRSKYTVDVTLMGPRYLQASRLEEILSNMTCVIEHSDSKRFWYTVAKYGAETNPADFRQTCRHHSVRSVWLKLHSTSVRVGPKKYDRIFFDISAIRSFHGRHLLPPANVLDFVVHKLAMVWDPPTERKGDLGNLTLETLLADGRMLLVRFWLRCDSPEQPMGESVVRDCTRGTPYQHIPRFRTVTSDDFPDMCSLNSSDPVVLHVRGVLRAIFSDRIMLSTLQAEGVAEVQGDVLPQLRGVLEKWCRRHEDSLIHEFSGGGVQMPRIFIAEIASAIASECYSFKCQRWSWQSIAVWMALVFPIMTLLRRLCGCFAPTLYRFAAERQRRQVKYRDTVSGGVLGDSSMLPEASRECINISPQFASQREDEHRAHALIFAEIEELKKANSALSLRFEALEARQAVGGGVAIDISGGRCVNITSLASNEEPCVGSTVGNDTSGDDLGAAAAHDGAQFAVESEFRFEKRIVLLVRRIVDEVISKQLEQLCSEIVPSGVALPFPRAAPAHLAGDLRQTFHIHKESNPATEPNLTKALGKIEGSGRDIAKQVCCEGWPGTMCTRCTLAHEHAYAVANEARVSRPHVMFDDARFDTLQVTERSWDPPGIAS
eukprot:TRINITY_DN36160_c0_g1_i1.p1 TRINITY_DN36160_c0_g1~~TRINITY_DN36160_c0_g1_i1.p1  ORF type:complete len:730 (+),score=88.13 TRINITY_DN36160_c0_g1_i1:91-2190(+)